MPVRKKRQERNVTVFEIQNIVNDCDRPATVTPPEAAAIGHFQKSAVIEVSRNRMSTSHQR